MGVELRTEFRVSDDIRLRSFRDSDVELVYDAVRRNLEHLRPFMHWVTDEYSVESAREFVARSADRSGEPRGPHSLGIFREDRLIGVIGFVSFDWKVRKTEIGYWVDKDEEGKGVVSAAFGVLLRYCFGELGLNRVEIRCSTQNLRSAAIPERFGFTKEGVLRQSEFRNGKLHDFAVYGLLAVEWDPSRPAS